MNRKITSGPSLLLSFCMAKSLRSHTKIFQNVLRHTKNECGLAIQIIGNKLFIRCSQHMRSDKVLDLGFVKNNDFCLCHCSLSLREIPRYFSIPEKLRSEKLISYI